MVKLGPGRTTLSPSVSSRAASIPSSEVPLIRLMTLRRLQQAGHRPILLMGGGTTKAGDPSGKDETRLILSPEQIDENKRSMLGGVQHLLKFGDGPSDAIMVDNADWLDRWEYIP